MGFFEGDLNDLNEGKRIPDCILLLKEMDIYIQTYRCYMILIDNIAAVEEVSMLYLICSEE